MRRCRQITFITDSLQYFFSPTFNQRVRVPAASATVRAPRGRKPRRGSCWAFYDLILWHLMAHLRAHLNISPKLGSVCSGTSPSSRRRVFLLGIAQHSLAHSFAGPSFCLALPNTCLSASVWNSIFSDVDWIFMHFPPPPPRQVFFFRGPVACVFV